MNNQRALHLQSLTQVISDYRQNEIATITPSHVDRWLSQFDTADQPIILAEMNLIMKRLYLSKTYIKTCIRNFLKDDLIGSRDPKLFLPFVSFLRLAQGGRSQTAMLGLVDELLREEYGIPINMTGTQKTSTYIYIDDAIYTGNTLRYDLTRWIPTCPSSDCNLVIYTIAAHKNGGIYATNHIRSAAAEKGISVETFAPLVIEDTSPPWSNIAEVLRPEQILNNPLLDSYTSHLCTTSGRKLQADEIFRRSSNREEELLFSSFQARRVVERAFLLKGIELVQASQNPAQSIRPLGYMKLASLGFGTLLVTYRNIANNCPLVLWWGDPHLPSTHPPGKWYPLFPRKINNMV